MSNKYRSKILSICVQLQYIHQSIFSTTCPRVGSVHFQKSQQNHVFLGQTVGFPWFSHRKSVNQFPKEPVFGELPGGAWGPVNGRIQPGQWRRGTCCWFFWVVSLNIEIVNGYRWPSSKKRFKSQEDNRRHFENYRKIQGISPDMDRLWASVPFKTMCRSKPLFFGAGSSLEDDYIYI